MELSTYILERALILIPALVIMGSIIKDTSFIADKYIPVILLVLGILGAIALMGFSVDSIIQGILVAGAAVFGNQIFKQFRKEE